MGSWSKRVFVRNHSYENGFITHFYVESFTQGLVLKQRHLKRLSRKITKPRNGLFPCLFLNRYDSLVNEAFHSTYFILLFLLDIFEHFLFNLKNSNNEEQLDTTQS